RRAVRESLRDAIRVDDAGERLRPPGDLARVLGLRDRPALLDQPEARRAQPAGGDQPLDVRDREEIVEAPLLGARHGERPLLPVLGEELVGVDRLDAAGERTRRGAGARAGSGTGTRSSWLLRRRPNR